jgi:hypothetical protein
MSAFTLNNKLSGTVHCVLEDFPIDRMPESGIFPMPVVLEERIGSEMGLFLIDKTPFIDQIKNIQPFRFLLKPGCVRTDHGPLIFLLFYVPNPNGSAEPVFAYDCHVNPLDWSMVLPWRDLSRQTHWHLILVNGDSEQVGLFEFVNDFRLGERLDLIAKACKGMSVGGFDLAKAEFCNSYSLAELFQLE